MKNRQHIILFILITALVQFTCQVMYRMLDNDYAKTSFLFQFSVNLPACIFIGGIDFLIINTVYKKIKWKDNGVRILIDLTLTSLFVLIFAITSNYLISSDNIYFYMTKFLLSLIVWNTILVLLIEIFFYNRRQAEAEKIIAMIEKEKIQYQYEMLKAQINPHFLFNSLNVLSSLAYKDPEKTNLFAKKMSGIYRYLLLTNTCPTVSLKEELVFLESYIFLEQIRFENALFVKINRVSNLHKQIIPVSLQLLVENAVKHNITTSSHPLTICVDIYPEGIEVSNNLQLRSSVDKNGVGLINLQKQYALYHKKIEIIQTKTEFTAKIPFIE